jgi:glycerol-3-phosphate O-acyltransferase / dihydroxyacetone phosphate acyltransferase
MRAVFTALCRLLLRIFFREIASVNADRVPREHDAPVLYVLNHPNALLDPLFILCLSPRPVTFLAKAPLFSTFLVKHFVRAFECLPVYRSQDGDDPSKNRASIEASIALLGSGKALALFPEGTSHSKPQLEPLKTGAARIALSASARMPASAGEPERTPRPVLIVPVGLAYADKSTFRSRALLVYGEPLTTPVVTLDEHARPPNDVAERLTARIAEGLAAVTVQAKTHEVVSLARSTARILAAAGRDGDDDHDANAAGGELARLTDLEIRLAAGYERLREREPVRVERTVQRVRQFEDALARLGLPVDHPAKLERARATRWTFVQLASLTALLLPGLVGIVVHFLPYRIIDVLAHRVARRQGGGEDVLATLKLIAGLLVFPLTWALLAIGAALVLRPIVALVIVLTLPISAWAGLRFVELSSNFVVRARGAWMLATRRDLGTYVQSERAAIRAEVTVLAEQLDRAA